MTTGPQGSRPLKAAQDVAHLGLVRPPLVFLTSLVAGVLIQLAKPLPFLPGMLAMSLGAFLVVVANRAVIVRSCRVPRRRHAGARTTANHRDRQHGPYRFSRSPIYPFSLLQLGIAIWANSLWLLAALAVAVALSHYVVIPREEEYLERQVGVEYLDYKRTVSRWL